MPDDQAVALITAVMQAIIAPGSRGGHPRVEQGQGVPGDPLLMTGGNNLFRPNLGAPGDFLAAVEAASGQAVQGVLSWRLPSPNRPPTIIAIENVDSGAPWLLAIQADLNQPDRPSGTLRCVYGCPQAIQAEKEFLMTIQISAIVAQLSQEMDPVLVQAAAAQVDAGALLVKAMRQDAVLKPLWERQDAVDLAETLDATVGAVPSQVKRPRM